jgi:F0F1-type ATP synthase assembly protein I
MNSIRILTGLPAGIVCGVAVGIIFDEIGSFGIFKKTPSSEE